MIFSNLSNAGVLSCCPTDLLLGERLPERHGEGEGAVPPGDQRAAEEPDEPHSVPALHLRLQRGRGRPPQQPRPGQDTPGGYGTVPCSPGHCPGETGHAGGQCCLDLRCTGRERGEKKAANKVECGEMEWYSQAEMRTEWQKGQSLNWADPEGNSLWLCFWFLLPHLEIRRNSSAVPGSCPDGPVRQLNTSLFFF